MNCIIRRLNRGNFYLLSHSFEIWCDSLGEWKLATNAKFQLSFYKLMPARPKKTQVHML